MDEGSDDEGETDERVLRHHPDFVPEIFPVNKPPNKKQRVLVRGGVKSTSSSSEPPPPPLPPPPPPQQRRGGRGGRGGGGRGGGGGGGASDAAAAVGADAAKKKSQSIERPMDEKCDTELLDARDVPDADELYSENERALSQFIRLHPMLSMESTSERTLSTAASLVDAYSLPTRELETVSKTHDDLFLRRANSDVGERSCVNGEKCVCRWLAIFRYGEETNAAFVCREFLLPSQLADFNTSARLPKTQGKCLLCTRYFTAYTYTLARSSPSFCPKSCISIQAFGNLIESKSPEDDVVGHSNAVGGEGGYRPDAMLYIDEKWTNTAASRGPIGTLLWRPVVRFRTSDYVFVKDVDSGLYRIIQTAVGAEAEAVGGGGGGGSSSSGVNFGQPPFSPAVRVEA